MKRRGFTLIELLAVIIILAIIALIATPIIMRVIENSKKGAAERSAENYARTVETLIVAERLNGNVIEDGLYTLDSNGDVCLDSECTNRLVITMTGSRPSSGKVKIENEKVIAYSITVGEYKNTYGEISILPNEYQEVEYLESTGTQYIDTGVLWDSSNGFTIGFIPTQFSSAGMHYFGAYNNERVILSDWTGYGQGNFAISSLGNDAHLTQNVLNEVSYISNNYSVNQIFYYNVGIIFVNNNFWLYGSQQRQGPPFPIYYAKIYNNNDIIRDFVPCYSTTTVTDVGGNECSEGTAGLYDLVEGKFYTNQGDGDDFIVGNDV